MNTLARRFTCVVMAPVLLFGACALRPDWAARLGLDIWKMPDWEDRAEQERNREAQIDEQRPPLLASEESRDRIDDELLSGRIRLRDAAARYRDLNASVPGRNQILRSCYPGDSDEERCCRQVIQRVGARLRRESPAEARRVTNALEAELSDHLRRAAAGRQRE